MRNLLREPVFGKDAVNWFDMLPTKTEQYIVKTQSSTKLSPKQALLKKNEKYVHHNLLDKTKNVKRKNEMRKSEQQIFEKCSRKEIQLIGHINCREIQNLLMIQYRVVALTIYQSVIKKPC